MGSPEFARIILSSLGEAGFPIIGVFAQPDKPAGRGKVLTPCSVSQYARDRKLPLFQPDNLKEKAVQEIVEHLSPDLIVVVAYGKWIPPGIIRGAKIDAINVHASLLPRYRGAAPIQWTLINGEKETGVSIMRVISKMDAGPVYAQAKTGIMPADNEITLGGRLATIGARLLVGSIPGIVSGELKAAGQEESQATPAPKLRKKDGHVDWTKSAVEIHNLIRGIMIWPKAMTSFDNKQVTLYDSRRLPEQTGLPPGTVYLVNQGGIHVACGDAALLLTEVQMEGKKRMTAADFAHGHRIREGQKFL